jgi:hypothetical protein
VSGVVDEGSSKPASASPTGLVVVGDLIGEGSVQEQSVVGETPNLAAGLQALARRTRSSSPANRDHRNGFR